MASASSSVFSNYMTGFSLSHVARCGFEALDLLLCRGEPQHLLNALLTVQQGIGLLRMRQKILQILLSRGWANKKSWYVDVLGRIADIYRSDDSSRPTT